MSLKQIDNMIINFIDSAFESYKEEFYKEYKECTSEEEFIDYACHDFLFCSVLHGEPDSKYNIRHYYDNTFRRLMENNIRQPYYDSTFKMLMETNITTYCVIVEIVSKYFRENPDEACQEIESYKPDVILLYYCFVFVKLNQDAFIKRHSPFVDLYYDTDSASEFEDD